MSSSDALLPSNREMVERAVLRAKMVPKAQLVEQSAALIRLSQYKNPTKRNGLFQVFCGLEPNYPRRHIGTTKPLIGYELGFYGGENVMDHRDRTVQWLDVLFTETWHLAAPKHKTQDLTAVEAVWGFRETRFNVLTPFIRMTQEQLNRIEFAFAALLSGISPKHL